jgi:hypothetical protein
MTRNMTQSFIVKLTTQHFAHCCNGHALLIGFGRIWVQWRTHQSAWFGATADLNRHITPSIGEKKQVLTDTFLSYGLHMS